MQNSCDLAHLQLERKNSCSQDMNEEKKKKKKKKFSVIYSARLVA